SAKSHHVVGEIGAERVGLHDPVGIEPHRQVLAELEARLPLAEEPAPGLIAAVEADLVGLAEDALEGGLVRLPHHDELAIGRRELAAELERQTTGREHEGEERRDSQGPAHARDYHMHAQNRSIGPATPTSPRAPAFVPLTWPRGADRFVAPWRPSRRTSGASSRRTSPTSTGPSSPSSTCPRSSRARCSRATRARR